MYIFRSESFSPPGPSHAGPSPPGPSLTGPSPPGPSPPGPSPPGPSLAGPSPPGPSLTGPSPPGPSPPAPSSTTSSPSVAVRSPQQPSSSRADKHKNKKFEPGIIWIKAEPEEVFPRTCKHKDCNNDALADKELCQSHYNKASLIRIRDELLQRDQPQREQAEREQPQRENAQREKAHREKAQKEQAQREKAQRKATQNEHPHIDPPPDEQPQPTNSSAAVTLKGLLKSYTPPVIKHTPDYTSVGEFSFQNSATLANLNATEMQRVRSAKEKVMSQATLEDLLKARHDKKLSESHLYIFTCALHEKMRVKILEQQHSHPLECRKLTQLVKKLDTSLSIYKLLNLLFNLVFTAEFNPLPTLLSAIEMVMERERHDTTRVMSLLETVYNLLPDTQLIVCRQHAISNYRSLVVMENIFDKRLPNLTIDVITTITIEMVTQKFNNRGTKQPELGDLRKYGVTGEFHQLTEYVKKVIENHEAIKPFTRPELRIFVQKIVHTKVPVRGSTQHPPHQQIAPRPSRSSAPRTSPPLSQIPVSSPNMYINGFNIVQHPQMNQYQAHPTQHPMTQSQQMPQQMPRPQQQMPRPQQQMPRPQQQMPHPQQQMSGPQQPMPRPQQQMSGPQQQMPRPQQQMSGPQQQMPRPQQQIPRPQQFTPDQQMSQLMHTPQTMSQQQQHAWQQQLLAQHQSGRPMQYDLQRHYEQQPVATPPAYNTQQLVIQQQQMHQFQQRVQHHIANPPARPPPISTAQQDLLRVPEPMIMVNAPRPRQAQTESAQQLRHPSPPQQLQQPQPPQSQPQPLHHQTPPPRYTPPGHTAPSQPGPPPPPQPGPTAPQPAPVDDRKYYTIQEPGKPDRFELLTANEANGLETRLLDEHNARKVQAAAAIQAQAVPQPISEAATKPTTKPTTKRSKQQPTSSTNPQPEEPAPDIIDIDDDEEEQAVVTSSGHVTSPCHVTSSTEPAPPASPVVAASPKPDPGSPNGDQKRHEAAAELNRRLDRSSGTGPAKLDTAILELDPHSMKGRSLSDILECLTKLEKLESNNDSLQKDMEGRIQILQECLATNRRKHQDYSKNAEHIKKKRQELLNLCTSIQSQSSPPKKPCVEPNTDDLSIIDHTAAVPPPATESLRIQRGRLGHISDVVKSVIEGSTH